MNIEDDADILVGYVAAALDHKAWDKARAKIVEYLNKYNNENKDLIRLIGAWRRIAVRAGNEVEAQQAKIDSLMLEYCPNEMTQDQIDNWEKHQVVAELQLPKEPCKNCDECKPVVHLEDAWEES